jgi:hypothetical protein
VLGKGGGYSRGLSGRMVWTGYAISSLTLNVELIPGLGGTSLTNTFGVSHCNTFESPNTMSL